MCCIDSKDPNRSNFYGDEDLGVGGNGAEAGDVVGLGNEIELGAQEQADGSRRVIRRIGSEGEIGLARGLETVACKATR